MPRLTDKNQEGYKLLCDDTATAIDKLGRFEDLMESLMKQQEEYSKELDKLREAGKKNSVKFREIMGKKLMNSHVISLMGFTELL